MDKKDLQIIGLLEQNGRLSFAAVGEQIGLSKTPCWSRVQQLTEQGVIAGYAATINPNKLGLQVRALVHVIVDFSVYQAFEQAIVAHKAIRACHAVTGEFDYVLEVLAADINDFDSLLRVQLSQLPGVQRFNTALSTRVVKQDGPYSAML
jgi:Lrp/AsnC family leucine-responsive transcriptional regulator